METKFYRARVIALFILVAILPTAAYSSPTSEPEAAGAQASSPERFRDKVSLDEPPTPPPPPENEPPPSACGPGLVPDSCGVCGGNGSTCNSPQCAFHDGINIKHTPYYCLTLPSRYCRDTSRTTGWTSQSTGGYVNIVWWVPSSFCFDLARQVNSAYLVFDGKISGNQVCGCVRTNNGGCFAPGTSVLLPDGSSKAVEEVFAGDYLYNPKTGRPAQVIQVVESAEGDGLYEVGFGSSRVTVNSTHPFVTDSGLKKARDLSFADSLQGSDGKFHRIEFLRQNESAEGQTVINFVLDSSSGSVDDHFLVADGIVTGDLAVQLGLVD